LDFGPNPSYSIPIYAFPGVAGQHNIVDAVPPNSTYSAFWNERKYVVKSGYVAETYKSFSDVAAAGITYTDGKQGINCPITKVYPVDNSNKGDASHFQLFFTVIFALIVALI